MQVFELYFNPKNETKISESFHHQPKDAYEGKIGKLYMVGEISNPEKKDYSLLQNIFHIAKEHYYKDTSLAPEKALKETLKELNDFIRERGCAGKTDIVLVSSKNFFIHFGKMGRIKVFLSGKEKIEDIGEELENTGSNVFSNMVSGKMKKEDKLMVFTPEIHKFFKKAKIVEEMAKEKLDEKLMEKISSMQKEKAPKISGVALIMDHSISLKEKKTKIVSKGKSEIFSFKEIFLDTLHSAVKIKIPKFKVKKPSIKIKSPSVRKRSFLLPLLLLGVVFLGILVLGVENTIKRNRHETEISLIKEKISQGRESNDFSLMEDALYDLELFKKETRFKEEVKEIHSSLSEELFLISKGEIIEEVVFLGKINQINPDIILFADDRIYTFSSDSPEISIFNPASAEEIPYTLPVDNGLDFASFSANKIILFSSPETLVFIEDEEISKLEIEFSEEEIFVSLSSFLGRPYFLNSSGDIIRYINKTPSSWIKEEKDIIDNGISMAIDGSIFVLTAENKIHRYHEGEKRETLSPFVFPSLSNATRIYTSSEAPLFLLDPKEKRIIVMSKEGDVIKQLFNDNFNNLKDIAITKDGKKIYLLINKEVYSLEL